jgi:radical SAM protein with 4Fe4S-binding SPASM domain
MTTYKASLAVQWHLTNKCQKKCKHCYMFDNNYKKMLSDELSYEEIINVLNDFDNFEKKWKINISSYFLTGGDPFLRDDFENILLELYKRGKKIYIMANPESVTATNIRIMQKYNIRTFQISLDGLEKTHDHYRGKGHFRKAISKINYLNENGINCRVMFTLTNDNKNEMFSLIDYLETSTSASGFAFDLCSNSGNASQIDTYIKNDELLNIFQQYLRKKKQYKKEGRKLFLAEKPTLMNLLHYSNNDYPTFFLPETTIVSGCLIGTSCITIMPNGDIEACRRYPSTIGNLRNEKIEDIFLGNETLKKFRRPQFYKDCGTCKFFKFCRGCPALSGRFETEPIKIVNCLKEELGLTEVLYTDLTPIPMSTSYDEEAKLIYNFMQNKYDFKYKNFYNRQNIHHAVGSIILDRKYRIMLCDEYQKFQKKFSLNDEELEFVQYYYIAAIKKKKIFIPLDI